jgi:leader peptidase (prepilin peptidase)/N-methyltransferase
MLLYAALIVEILIVFLLGAAVGSFLNVCVGRLRFEKSILWPGSRCGHCLQPIRWYDNLPLVSYWVLHGHCRTCGVRFSVGYFLIELGTGLAFAGLFYLEVVLNVLDLPGLAGWHHDAVLLGYIPLAGWVVFVHHILLLLSLLLVTSLCDLHDMEIPLPVTVTGTLIGLVTATLFPWPFPGEPPGWQPPPPTPQVPGFPAPLPHIEHGLYPWPVWRPDQLPSWMPPGSWQLGLVTGLAGAAAGMLALRAVRFLFGFGRGIEGLGVGDADLMMMAGAFVGWQPVLAAFLVGVFPALFFGIAQIVFRGGQALPFGPSLAIGVVLTLLGWHWIGRYFETIFFWPEALGTLVAVGAVLLLVTSFMLRLLRGTSTS